MSFDDDYELLFKVVLIGDSGVGKSNILSRYLKDEFSMQTKTTVGVEFGAKKIEIDQTKIKAQIWDTAGQERYKSITSAYYKGSLGALLVYDVTKRETFESVDRWITDLKKNAQPDVTVVLIGNKVDLTETMNRKVTQEEAEAKAADHKIAFLETSALRKINIDKAFHLMIEEIYKNHQKKYGDKDEDLDDVVSDNKAQNVFDLNTQTKNGEGKTKKKSCC